MGDLAKKDNAHPIQPAQGQPTPYPVETRRVEHVIIPPPGGFGPPQSVPIQPQQPGAPASQTIIYINNTPAPQPAQPAPAPPQQPPIQPKVMQYTSSQDAPARRPIHHEKGLSILGLAGFALGLAAIYLRLKPTHGLDPVHVALVGLALAVLGFLTAIGGGKSRAGLPFLAILLCGSLVAISYGWHNRAIEELEKKGVKVPVQIKEILPKTPPATAPALVPATPPAPVTPPAKQPLVPAVVPTPPPATAPGVNPTLAPPAADSAKQAREAVEAAERNLKAAQDRALAGQAEYQNALIVETVTAKERDAARQSGVDLQDAARKHMDAQSLVTKLRREILANDPAVKSSEQVLKNAEQKLAVLK